MADNGTRQSGNLQLRRSSDAEVVDMSQRTSDIKVTNDPLTRDVSQAEIGPGGTPKDRSHKDLRAIRSEKSGIELEQDPGELMSNLVFRR